MLSSIATTVLLATAALAAPQSAGVTPSIIEFTGYEVAPGCTNSSVTFELQPYQCISLTAYPSFRFSNFVRGTDYKGASCYVAFSSIANCDDLTEEYPAAAASEVCWENNAQAVSGQLACPINL